MRQMINNGHNNNSWHNYNNANDDVPFTAQVFLSGPVCLDGFLSMTKIRDLMSSKNELVPIVTDKQKGQVC